MGAEPNKSMENMFIYRKIHIWRFEFQSAALPGGVGVDGAAKTGRLARQPAPGVHQSVHLSLLEL